MKKSQVENIVTLSFIPCSACPVPLFSALCSHPSMLAGWGGILVRLPAAVAAGQRHRLHGPPGELQRRSRHQQFSSEQPFIIQNIF